MWDDFLSAIALVLVIEGILPFLSPGGYRRAVLSMVQMHDKNLRTAGLISMLAGLFLLYIFRG